MSTIVFLGDSLTWGGYGGNFVDHVAQQLPDHTIINAGVGGDTVVNLLRRVDDVLDDYEPDVMFVMVGGNDAISYTQSETRGYYRHSKKLDNGQVTPDDFATAYRDLMQKIQLRFVQPLIGLAPTEYNRDVVEAKRQYNDITRDIARSLNIPILDLDAMFTPENPIEREPVGMKFIIQIGERSGSGWSDFEAERQKWGYSYTFDGMHLLPQSAKKFADIIVDFLKKQVSLS